MSRPGRIFLVVLCLLCLGAPIPLILREYQAAVFLRATVDQQIEALVAHSALPNPASLRSIREILSACGWIMASAPRLGREPETAHAVRQGCATIAARILHLAPGHGRARAVTLYAAGPAITEGALLAAQKAAPHEPWPLLIRLAALVPVPAGRSALFNRAEADVQRALTTSWGRAGVAALHAERPDLRPWITRLAAAQPDAVQAAFVTEVRQALAVRP